MRGVSRWASRVAPFLLVFVVFTAASAWADDPPVPPTDPPEARMNPPVGVTTQARMNPPVGVAPPPEDETTQARLGPPVGAQSRSLMDMIVIWLQSRIGIPNG
jgi:hypothetical protein